MNTNHARRQILLAALGAPFLLKSRGLWAAGTCKTAATSTLGANYKADAPSRTTYLADPAEPGSALRVTGLITAADSCRRLREATIEVWQADATGHYDGVAAKLRGRFVPDALGRYTFDTVVPGHSGDGARCIHFRITHKGFEPHITRCFFAGDEREHTDVLVKPELVVGLTDANDEARPGLLLANFDVSLTPATPVTAALAATWLPCAGTYDIWLDQKLVISVGDKELRWVLSRPDNPGEATTGSLYPRGDNLFFCPEYDYTVAFVKDETGKVMHALLRGKQIARKTA